MRERVEQQQERREKGQHAGDVQFVRAPFPAAFFEPDNDQRNRDSGDR